MISAPHRAASCMTSSPAQTSVSLLARAMRFRSRMAASVGRRPIMPDTAVTTVSALGSVAASSRPSIPEATRIVVSASRTFNAFAADSSIKTANSGRYLRHWASIRSTSRFALSAATRSPRSSATSSVCRPMEPVEPKIEMAFVTARPPSTSPPHRRPAR